jgi:hypothetical protein
MYSTQRKTTKVLTKTTNSNENEAISGLQRYDFHQKIRFFLGQLSSV